MVSLTLAMLMVVGGCAGSAAGPVPVTLLDGADPIAKELIAYLELRHVPMRTIDGRETRIEATPQCRDALIRFMELTRLRMETCAANIANVNTSRDADGKPMPYRRQFVVVTSTGATEICLDQSPFHLTCCPGHPDADAAGMVKYPNVDLAVEYVVCQQALRDYEMATAVLQRLDPSIVVGSLQPSSTFDQR